MNEELIPFYLQGRAVKSLSRLKKYLAAPDEIAEAVTKGQTVRTAVGAACDATAKQIEGERKRKASWLVENKDELAESRAAAGAGHDDAAWKAYCQGMSDELAYSIEADVLDALEGDEDGDEEDGDDADDDDDDDKDKEPS